MKKSIELVKVKIFLGYFTLVALATLIIWISYTEIQQYSRGRVDFNPSNNKFKLVNAILTNLYQAEGLERNYIQTGQMPEDYPELMKTISMQIDALVLMIKDPDQQIHTYNIKKLLQMKQQNLDELSAIKETNSSNASYRKGMNKSVNASNLTLNTRKVAKFNSGISENNSADATAKDKTGILTKTMNNGDATEIRLKQKELEILNSDRTITFQLRQMLSYLEKEELERSFQKVKEQEIRVQKATGLIILLGSLALIATIIFLINIIRDITRSQRYRKDLETAKAYSESLLKSKEQFMLSLTHDLKSPLNSIIGFTGFMEKDLSISFAHRKYLQNISSASNHILKLVNDLLDIARLETGKLAIDRIPFDFKRLINDIAEGFNPQAREKNIDLQLQFSQSPSEVYMGDPAMITRIFSNLFSNAIKFTESGNVMIKVSLPERLENIDKIQVDVIDTGIGISEDDTQRVFEEFNRARITKKQYEGTGLGLTITKKIVELHQGTIMFKSKPGVGTHFTVVLPLERGEEEQERTTQLNNNDDAYSGCDISGIKIWLVDDDQLLLDMCSIVLQSAGGEVHSFRDPLDAINSFNKGCADLLITDIQMPGMNGIELLKQIQKKNEGHITAIAISGKNPLQNEYDGFSAFIQKPFQAHTLIDVICLQQKEMIKYNQPEVPSNIVAKEYTLDQLSAFAEGDQANLNQILVSLIDSSNQNLKLLMKYIEEEDARSIVEIAHKMLTVFRQLEATEIVELLVSLEQNSTQMIEAKHFYTKAKMAREKIDLLIQTIKRDENIFVN